MVIAELSPVRCVLLGHPVSVILLQKRDKRPVYFQQKTRFAQRTALYLNETVLFF